MKGILASVLALALVATPAFAKRATGHRTHKSGTHTRSASSKPANSASKSKPAGTAHATAGSGSNAAPKAAKPDVGHAQ